MYMRDNSSQFQLGLVTCAYQGSIAGDSLRLINCRVTFAAILSKHVMAARPKTERSLFFLLLLMVRFMQRLRLTKGETFDNGRHIDKGYVYAVCVFKMPVASCLATHRPIRTNKANVV